MRNSSIALSATEQAQQAFAVDYRKLVASGHGWQPLCHWFSAAVAELGARRFGSNTELARQIHVNDRSISLWSIRGHREPCPLQLQPTVRALAATMLEAGLAYRQMVISYKAGLATAAYCLGNGRRAEMMNLLQGDHAWTNRTLKNWSAQIRRDVESAGVQPPTSNPIEQAIIATAKARQDSEGAA